MTTMLPPVYGVAFEFDVVLFAQSDNQIKTSPTIAAGDFVISKANGATANLTTTPGESPASSGIVRVQLSATEMEADKLTVKFHDASGAEWHDGAVTIFTTGQTFNTMDTNIDAALADTNELQTDWANGGRLDVILDARASQTTADDILTDTDATIPALIADVPTNAELAAALGTADDAVLAAIAALNNLSSAGAQAAAAVALAAYDAATGADVSGLSIPAASAIADAVWDEATAGHATAGSTGAALAAAGSAGDPWGTALPGAYGAGTAGSIVGGWDDSVFAAVATAAAVNGSDLSIHRGDTFSASIAGLGNIGARTQLYWTVKESPNIADASATVHVEEDAGLVYLNGAAGTAGQGDITVTDATDGDITITLAAAATATLTPGVYVYDVQMVTATGVETLTAANLTVVADVTRAVV